MRKLTMMAAGALSLTATSFAASAQAEELTLCWAAWDPANALVELSKEFEAQSGHTMTLASEDAGYRAVLQAADCVFGDGTGVRWAMRHAHGVRPGPLLIGEEERYLIRAAKLKMRKVVAI